MRAVEDCSSGPSGPYFTRAALKGWYSKISFEKLVILAPKVNTVQYDLHFNFFKN